MEESFVKWLGKPNLEVIGSNQKTFEGVKTIKCKVVWAVGMAVNKCKNMDAF